MKIYSLTGFPSALTGSFTGSFVGDGSGLSGTDSGSWDGDFVGSAKITGSLSLSGSFKDQESSPGTVGQVLSSTVSGSKWINAADSGAITGTGTTGTITKWTTGGSVIGDSIIAESASTITVNGVGKFTGNILALANIGVGMTPDTSWGSNSHIINLGIANADAGHIGWREQGGADELSIGWNVYHNNTDWYYASSNPANLYTQISSGHVFKVAASGTEDNAISWINALSISSTGNTAFVGNVGIGISSPSVKLDVGGASNSDSIARFAKTSEGTLLLGGNVGPSNCPFIGSENNFDFAFITNNTEKMRVTKGGNLQMKNDAFLSWYTGAGTEVENIGIQASDATSTINFYTEALVRMSISNTGNVSVGAATVGHLGVRGLTNDSSAFSFEAANSSGNSILIVRNDGRVGIGNTNPSRPLDITADSGAVALKLRGRSANDFAFMSFYNNQNTVAWAEIAGRGTSSAATALDFYVGTTRKMSILANGAILNANPPTSAYAMTLEGSAVGGQSFGLKITASTGTNDMAIYAESYATSNLFYIRGDGAGYLKANAWTYGSDFRLKENIKDVENGIEMVSKMKPKHFDYIDGEKDCLGFIAQDVKEIIPQAVSVVNEDTGYLGLKTDFLVPYLVKAIQEQQTIIESQKSLIDGLITRIETLEG